MKGMMAGTRVLAVVVSLEAISRVDPIGLRDLLEVGWVGGRVKNEAQEGRSTFSAFERLKIREASGWDEKDLGRAPYMP